MQVEYQWTPIRCAKCKKFGHDCNKIIKPQISQHTKQPSKQPTIVHDEPPRHNSDDEWIVQGKGKKGVGHSPHHDPSSSNVTIGGNTIHNQFSALEGLIVDSSIEGQPSAQPIPIAIQLTEVKPPAEPQLESQVIRVEDGDHVPASSEPSAHISNAGSEISLHDITKSIIDKELPRQILL